MNPKVIRCSNSTVTDFYLDTVAEACRQNGINGDITVVATDREAVKAHLRGEKVVFWSQGITPEESYLRNHSNLRSTILSILERTGLKCADYLVFTSDYMKEHYEKKYKLKLDKSKYYVMPCFNTELFRESFFFESKYENNIFAYIGSLSPWQCFEKTIECYKEVEQLGLKNTRLEVYTPDQEKATNIIESTGIKNYIVDFKPNSEMPEVLSRIKYGFILRDDIEVNRVATPTKISTYLASGVIPIYSDCLRSFAGVAANMQFAVKETEMKEKLVELSRRTISPRVIYDEYKTIFDTYYSTKFHIRNMREMIK